MYKSLFVIFILLLAGACSKEFESAPIQEEDWYSDVYEIHENYTDFEENPFLLVHEHPSSKFWIDADGASFAKCRRLLLEENQFSPARIVMTEEFINYFNYDYEDPVEDQAVAINGEVSDCPWESEHRLLRVGLKGNTIYQETPPASNIVLLVDVTGSMADENRLPLLKKAFRLLAKNLRKVDKITIVTYTESCQIVLNGENGENKESIYQAIDNLEADYTMSDDSGLEKAFELVNRNIIEGGNNRIVLASDHNFLAGMGDIDQALQLISENEDVFFSVIGVGTDNASATMMERLADAGNGNFEYLADEEDARKLFEHEFGSLFVVAKDAQVRIDFNEEVVKKYRLIGFEHRRNFSGLNYANEDYAGEIGSGQTITALFQIETLSQGVVCEVEFECESMLDHGKYQVEYEILDEGMIFGEASSSHRFAASVASFTMMLRESQYKGNTDFNKIYNWAQQSSDYDPFGYKNQFLRMIQKAEQLSN